MDNMSAMAAMADEAGFTSAGHLGQNSPGTTALSSTTKNQHHHLHHRLADGDYESHDDSPSRALHQSHRQDHSSSRLPAFRNVDLETSPSAPDGPPSKPVPLEPARDTATAHPTQDLHTASPSRPVPLPSDGSPSASLFVSARQTSPEASPKASQSSPTIADPTAAQAQDAASFPGSPTNAVAQPCPPSAVTAARTQSRRAPVPGASNGIVLSDGSPLSINTYPAAEIGAQSPPGRDTPTRDWAQGQRELLLPKTLSQSPPDEKRTSTSHRAPPVSYKPPVNAIVAQSNATPVRVPPIRGFRSSGSRKSLNLDMARPYDMGDASDFNDPNYDHTLRALEGRHGHGHVILPMTPPASARQTAGDDTGDVFMRIAREEPARRDENTPDDTQTLMSRTMRPSHRRPLSTTVATYNPTSPPRLSRRLSDQQESARSQHYDDDRTSDVSRITTYRSTRDRMAPTQTGEDHGRTRTTGTVLRPSALTSRSTNLQDSSSDSPIYRRRPSMTETGSSMNRTPTYRSSGPGHGHTKSYNSSPLVRAYDVHTPSASDPHQGVEGTESTASTTAPSTVWDELDELKSRLHRLELTGKLPSTSGAAVSRLSDERPPTATTTVTTISSSPKRAAGGATQAADTTSITSSQREAHPILHSALTKSKPFLSHEVFRALESVANDAIGLSSMMGVPGQPGPISSGASTIGSGATVTDRQLRRKADSVCRSLTELCVALGEEATQPKAAPPMQTYTTPQHEGPFTPTTSKTFTGFGGQRRGSTAAEQSLPPSNVTSPRTISKFEERRNTLLGGSSLPSPRVINTNPPTPNEPANSRRSSLLVSRTRRADTEEPDDGRRSSMLRTRRAGTEEPDEGRRTSVLVRNRRGTVGEEEDEPRFRAPSRANTEVHATRGPAREYQQQAQAPAAVVTSQTASALPRRRFTSNFNSSRLATPASYNGAPPRKYLDRSTPERDNGATLDNSGERGQRPLSLGPSMTINRSGSLHARRQTRDSTDVSTAASVGAYR